MKKNKNYKNNLILNDNLFFLIEDGHVLVWDYESHNQYLIEKKYFIELLNLSKINSQIVDKKFINEFVKANLVHKHHSKRLTQWGWDILSKIFHLGTQNIGSESIVQDPDNFSKNYIDQCNSLKKMDFSFFLERQGILIDLPEPDLSLFNNISFFSVLKNRKTCRNFHSEFIKLDELSLILYCSFGLIHAEWDDLNQNDLEYAGIRKATPSSGGLHSEEIYLIAYRIDGLKPGLYHYRCHDHKLTQLAEKDFENEVTQMNYSQFFSEGLAFGIYITSRFDKIWWKYKHSRAYRGMLLDIGHVSQTFLLTSTALGLQTWITGAFHDAQVEDFLTLETNKESVILFVGAGKGSNQSIPKVMLDQLKN